MDDLVQIVDAAMADSVRRSGEWLACRPGCFECCLGPFPISESDAIRLREGLGKLQTDDPERAARVSTRAHDWVEEEDTPCPALDPETGTCDLYAWRPITCRTFGPPVRCESGALAICELCFVGASENEIGACVADLDPEILGSDDEIGRAHV